MWAAVSTIIGPLLLFGSVLALALPSLAWATRRALRAHRPAWLAASVYGWYFLALALVQLRFAGELSVFVAPFASLVFVHLAAAVDLA